jgi:LuxR family maltose regulon positive regulatory protein
MERLANSQLLTQRAQAWLAAQAARLHLWQGDLAATQRWDQDRYPFDETALGYLQQLTRVRIYLAQYTRDPQASFLAQATTILAPLLAAAEDKGWGSHVIEILLLQALIEHAQGQRAAARTTLIRALDVAEPAGYLRLFVDEGEPMRLLIVDCRLRITDARRLTYLDKILAALDEPSLANEVGIADTTSLPLRTPQSAIANLVEPLSERELEVLQLVAAGFSNGEIAARMIVATSTVKTHINHIFGKLGVQSRTQAVAQARNLGLV